jgi:hypothetical protein
MTKHIQKSHMMDTPDQAYAKPHAGRQELCLAG